MILDYGVENLRALVQGRKLNAVQMLLARNEFEQLLQSKEELSKLHQPTVISSVCNFCGSDNLEDCGGGEFTCNDCGHFPVFKNTD